MKMHQMTLSIAVLVAFTAPVSSGAAVESNLVDVMPWDLIHCGDYDADELVAAGGVLTHTFVDPADPTITVTVHTMCYAPGASGEADTDCTATAYALTGWKWSAAYSAKVDSANSGLTSAQVMGAFNSALSAWDQATSASISGSLTAGGNGAKAGRRDNVNQFGFKNLGGGGTIAQTTTWSSGGNAIESDGAYNTFFAWGVNGESNRMDLQGIGTHEIGHTFGLGHPPTTSQNSCLTMYAYGDYGQTFQRTLGDGDINGIRALYG